MGQKQLNEEQRSAMYRHACDTMDSMKGLNPRRCSKDEYLTYGASAAIISDYEKSGPVDGTLAPVIVETGVFPMPTIFSDYALLVEDELRDADKYAAYFKQTGKENHRQLAKQEVSHASFWIAEARQVAGSPADSEKIKMWQKRHDDTLASLMG